MTDFRQFLDRSTGSLSYLIACPAQGQALMIDPVLEHLPLYLGVLSEMGWRLTHVLETHVHADHVTAAAALHRQTGAAIGVCRRAGVRGAQLLLDGGDTVRCGDQQVTALATPGHTPACLTYCWRDRLFTGDCLLIGGCGDLAEPGANAARLYDTITRKLLSLPDETLVYPGHDWQGRQVSCIGEERRNNPLFQGHSRDAFVALASARPPPQLPGAEAILAANRRCGAPLSDPN